MIGRAIAENVSEDSLQSERKQLTDQIAKVNKLAAELEQQKQMIRESLESGDYSKMDKAYAQTLVKRWKMGAVHIPLYQEDWMSFNSSAPKSVPIPTFDSLPTYVRLDPEYLQPSSWSVVFPPPIGGSSTSKQGGSAQVKAKKNPFGCTSKQSGSAQVKAEKTPFGWTSQPFYQ